MADLNAKLATVCRAVAGRGEAPGTGGPAVVTPAVVREVLGAGDADALPPAVRAAIARERRRLGDASGADTATTNDWIEWLEALPWTRRAEAPVDLAQVRAALDTGHAGLDHAKRCLLEHLAVRRRNRHSPAVICLAGPPGVGKTSLAHCVAESLGRGFIRLSCGGLRDETRPAGPQPDLARRAAGMDPARDAAGRLARPGLRPRRDRQARPRAGGGPPRAARPGAARPVPRCFRRGAVRPLRGALHHDGERDGADPAGAAGPARDRRPARLLGGREGRHRPVAPDRGAEPGGRPRGHAGAVHRGRLPADRPGLHQRARGAAADPLPAGYLPPGGAGPRDRRQLARPRARHRAAGPRASRRAGRRPRRRPRASARTARGAGAACRRAGPRAAGPRAAVGVGADRPRRCPRPRVPRVPAERALDPAHRVGAARPGPRPLAPRCGPRGARRGQGARHRLRGGAPVEPGRPVAAAVPAGPARGRQVDPGGAARRSARAGVRVGVVRRAGERGAVRRPLGAAGAHRRRAAPRRRPQSTHRPRRGRPARRGGGHGGGAARRARPGPRRRLPRPLPRPAARLVRGALRGHRDQPRVRCRRCCGSG